MTTVRKDVQELFERAATELLTIQECYGSNPQQDHYLDGCKLGFTKMLAIVVQREGEPFHESFMRVDGMLHRMMQPSVLDELPIVLAPEGEGLEEKPSGLPFTGYDTGKPLYDDPI